MTILLIGGLSKSPIAGIRALARAGHEVDAAFERRAHQPNGALCFRSKYIRSCFVLPHPLEDQDQFTERLLELVRRGRYDAVLPWDHYSAIPIAQHRKDFSRYTGLAVPDYALYERVHDKAVLHGELREWGFEVPRFYTYQTLDELLAQPIEFPVVLKARKNTGVARGLRYATDPAELRAAYQEIERHDPRLPALDDFTRPFVQEYVPGCSHDCVALCNRGQLRAAMTQVRRDTYPVNGGITATGITTDEPGLVRYARGLLEALQWHGPCQVEVKKDARDGRYKLMEINPRFWGSIDLAIRAGINFPALTAALAANGDCREVLAYRVGLMYKFLLPTELYSIYQDPGRRLRRLWELRKLLTGGAVCELDWRDPKPNLLDAIQTFIGLLLKRDEIYAPPFSYRE